MSTEQWAASHLKNAEVEEDKDDMNNGREASLHLPNHRACVGEGGGQVFPLLVDVEHGVPHLPREDFAVTIQVCTTAEPTSSSSRFKILT